ncbi:hypothetical protein ACHAPU_009223 [Fusarium lateritium]
MHRPPMLDSTTSPDDNHVTRPSRDALYEFYTDSLCSQVRQGIANNTKGTAFVVYEDVTDAKQACDKLNGFNFQNRYLVVLYHQPDKMAKSKEDLEARRESLAQLKKQHGSRLPRLQAGLRLLPNLRRLIRRRSYEKAGPRPTKQPSRATHPPELSDSTTDFDLH